MSNLGESGVTINYTTNGDSIMMSIPKDIELAFKGYFCNYSAANEVAGFLYEETTSALLGMGSEKAAEYAVKAVGKESVGKVVSAIPYVGDIVGFGLDMALEQEEQKKALLFIEGQFDTINSANAYEDYDCSANYVYYDTAESQEHILYAYGGEKTEERIRRINELFQTELGKRITKEEVITEPNKVYELYEELVAKDIHNKDKYEEALNDK